MDTWPQEQRAQVMSIKAVGIARNLGIEDSWLSCHILMAFYCINHI